MVRTGGSTDLKTPPEVADALAQCASGARRVAELPTGSDELAQTIADIEILAELGEELRVRAGRHSHRRRRSLRAWCGRGGDG
jgi:hypothetical protein